jgi:hypothetical protein
MEYSSIEELVRSNVVFSGSVSASGWERLYCEVCGDGARTKGPRGAFLFEGDACFYNCFNCGIEGNFDPNREVPCSKHMWEILTSFGIQPREFNKLAEDAKKANGIKVVKRQPLILPKIDPIPDYMKLLREFPKDSLIADEARRFLWTKYKMTEDDYPFYLSTGKSKEDHYIAKALRPRIIIPAMYHGDMLYWQARIFVGESKSKYISASVKNATSVVFGMDNLTRHRHRPLYITEGFFDSWHVGGVATMTNRMKKGRIDTINRSARDKVILPDQNDDGMNLADQGIELGWGVSLPKIYPETDICGAINRFGKLYVMKSIIDNTYHGDRAKISLKIFKNEYGLTSSHK